MIYQEIRTRWSVSLSVSKIIGDYIWMECIYNYIRRSEQDGVYLRYIWLLEQDGVYLRYIRRLEQDGVYQIYIRRLEQDGVY